MGRLARGGTWYLHTCATAPAPNVQFLPLASQLTSRSINCPASGTTWRAASAPCLSRSSTVSCSGGEAARQQQQAPQQHSSSGRRMPGSDALSLLHMSRLAHQCPPVFPPCRAQVWQGRRRGRGPRGHLGGGAAPSQEAQVGGGHRCASRRPCQRACGRGAQRRRGGGPCLAHQGGAGRGAGAQCGHQGGRQGHGGAAL